MSEVITLTSSEALVLQCIESWWWTIVKKHSKPGRPCGRIDPDTGAPVTRLSATGVRQWMAERNIRMGLDAIRAALKGLVDKCVVYRQKEWACNWNQSYSYWPRLSEIRRFNPKMVGTRPITSEAWLPAPASATQPAETSQQPDIVPVENQCGQGLEPVEDAGFSSDLSDLSAVKSTASSSGTGIAALPSEPAEPEQPEVEPDLTSTPVKDEASIEHHQPPEKTQGSGGTSNMFNRAVRRIEQVVASLLETGWQYLAESDELYWPAMDACYTVTRIAEQRDVPVEAFRVALDPLIAF